MDIEFESNSKDIIEKCINIISNPKVVIVDRHSIGYLKNRKIIDNMQEQKALQAQIDDESYYNELSKEF